MRFVAPHNHSCAPLLLQALPLLQDTVLHKILLHGSLPGAAFPLTVLHSCSLLWNALLLEKTLSMWVPHSSSQECTPGMSTQCCFLQDTSTCSGMGLSTGCSTDICPWQGLLHKLQGNLYLEHLLFLLLHWPWCLQNSFYEILEINHI